MCSPPEEIPVSSDKHSQWQLNPTQKLLDPSNIAKPTHIYKTILAERQQILTTKPVSTAPSEQPVSVSAASMQPVASAESTGMYFLNQ